MIIPLMWMVVSLVTLYMRLWTIPFMLNTYGLLPALIVMWVVLQRVRLPQRKPRGGCSFVISGSGRHMIVRSLMWWSYYGGPFFILAINTENIFVMTGFSLNCSLFSFEVMNYCFDAKLKCTFGWDWSKVR